MNKYIVVREGSNIYGITPNKLYNLLGHDKNSCAVVENNSGELISIHQDYYIEVKDNKTQNERKE
jgi:hypothetical protein